MLYSKQQMPKNHPKIMIIDDERDFADMLKTRLEHHGYNVLALSDAKYVIRELHSFVPDVILLDLLMPGAGGLDAAEMLNSDPAGANIPIIVISGLSKDADKVKAYKLGIADYLVKPIDTDALLASIEKSIRAKSAED